MLFKPSKQKKAQSAMEYLMTYGWAILIIAVVLGALFSLGVFSGSNLLGSACVASSGYLCQSPGATIEVFPLVELLAKFDLTLQPGPLASDPYALPRHVALFLAMYFDRGRSAVNERLRRRVHWLAR